MRIEVENPGGDPEIQAMWTAYAAIHGRPAHEWARMLNWLSNKVRHEARKRKLLKRAEWIKSENPEKAAYARDMIMDAINLLRSEGLSRAELAAGMTMALAHFPINTRELPVMAASAVRHRENSRQIEP